MRKIVIGKPYKLNPSVMRWVAAFASCAIEGDSLGIEMMELWNGGKEDEFIKRLERDWQPELRETYQGMKPKPSNVVGDSPL